ncbi:hypothetical protein BG015_010021 [Linnemannia schmuckeri]|uniref:FZ domain-containing protein n=1 Tax=Linnemannia schmuckeri TaxID=64567 RepID=A0A9P5V9C7_9FUNG|nr:hypothetical protein BG015_010021 [Linnemannia schmuckeri]
MKTTALLSLSAALSVLASSVSAAATVRGHAANMMAPPIEVAGECRILKQESTLCPSIQYLTNINSPIHAEERIQEYIDAMPKEMNDLRAPCLQVLQEALCLVEFPKCKGQTQQVLPVCQSVRERVERICSEPFQKLHIEGSINNEEDDEASIMIARVRDQIFSPAALDPKRWAASAAVQEPDCVSWDDHGLGSAPIDNIRILNDLDDEVADVDTEVEAEESGDDDAKMKAGVGDELVRSTLETRHLSRRERGSKKHHHHHHHHHHHKAQKRNAFPVSSQKNEDKKVEAEAQVIVAPMVAIRANTPSAQGIYAINKDEPKVSISKSATAGVDKGKKVGDSKVLVHERLGHSKSSGDSPGQRVLMQGSYGDNIDPAKAVDNLGKASEGHPVDKDAAKAESEAASDDAHTHKETALLAAVPILLIMGAIAGFTIYRRYYENSFNQDGQNDSRDDLPHNSYHQRDLSIRKGSPIHFDRTFLNTVHSPPPTATYLHDPDSPSRNYHQHSPTSIAAGTSLKRPTPSAGAVGKNRFQELSRSYDFGAGLRSIKNALTRSNNNSREDGLNHAGSRSVGSLSGRNSGQYTGAFGAGGHSIARIGSHPGLNALERQQLQAQFGSGVGGLSASSSAAAAARFPDVHNVAAQDHSIVWGQYSANDEHDAYQDAGIALASNLGAARKSGSANSLSMLNSSGKYNHHHRQRSSDRQYQQQQRIGSPRDSIGDCLSPESHSMPTREELMRRRDLHSEGYAFRSETASVGDDAYSGTDLLFDGRNHFFDLAGSEKNAAGVSAQMIDEEMDMYLEMEKEESPFVVDDYNSMNPSPYEPKVLTRQMLERRQSIQKTAALREKEISEKAALNAEIDEVAAVKAARSQAKKDKRKLAKLAKKQQKQQGATAKVEEVFDEKQAMQTQDAAAVVVDTEAEQATHVLGCDSPDWKQ